MGCRSSSPSSTTSRSCVVPPTSTSGCEAVTRLLPRLDVTLGDPRGIGPEVVAKALAVGLDAGITLIGADEQVADIPAQRKIGVGAWARGAGSGEQGAGRLAGVAVEQAVALARAGEVDAIVTGPVNKHALHVAGFRYPGLTELVAHLAGGEQDAAIAPYHDVGMTAVKVAGFGTGVNVTLGLPFPRVAPDHGTALDIAGKGLADPGSMRAALELAVELARKARHTAA